MKINPTKKRFILLIALLFVQASFATDVNSLLEAIRQNKIEDIKTLLKEGIDPNKITYFSGLPPIESSKLLLENEEIPMDPTHFLSLILKINSNESSDKAQYTLINLALEMGANPNDKRIFYGREDNPEAAELLFNNEYKKIDPNVYCHNVKNLLMYGKTMMGHLEGNSLLLSNDHVDIIDLQYKHLHLNNTITGPLPRIPRKLHHIWVTNEKIKKEISDTDIQYMSDSYNVITRGDQPWEHIVWTNNKNSIPISVEKLEAHGIRVREISELKDELKLGEKIDDLIEKGLFGMAFDAARLDIVRICGGVISDMNFEFSRGLKSDIFSYDFFTNSYGNAAVVFQGFGTIPHHPILEEAVDLINKNYDDQVKIAALLGVREDSKQLTHAITGGQLTIAYHRQANKHGTIDVLYPYNTENADDIYQGKMSYKRRKECFTIHKKYLGDLCSEELGLLEKNLDLDELTQNREICGPRDISIGYDRPAESWVGTEQPED